MDDTRLTKQVSDRNYVPLADGTTMEINHCCSYCKDIAQSDCNDCSIQRTFNKLGELEDMIEDGVLIELPVALGTPVYVLCHNNQFINTSVFRISDLPLWGSRVFRTPEDALKVAPNAKVSRKVQNAGT